MFTPKLFVFACSAAAAVALSGCAGLPTIGRETADAAEEAGNPLFTDVFTADPAPLVHDGRVYVYVGHDTASDDEPFNMPEWLVYSSPDMLDWQAHGIIMKPTDFAWASRSAWASEVEERDGKFFFYATVEHDKTRPGKAIGVAVADNPTGPFIDARGSALVANDMTPDGPSSWDDIDPTVFVDDDGTAYLYWGNTVGYYARLADNMIELDSEIMTYELPFFIEGPWIHKRGDWYYLTYAGMDRSVSEDEQIHYAMARSVEGPWDYKGMLMGSAENSWTIHPGIIEFEGQWYFFYHDGTLTIDGVSGSGGRRAVKVEPLEYNEDGTIRPMTPTRAGARAVVSGR